MITSAVRVGILHRIDGIGKGGFQGSHGIVALLQAWIVHVQGATLSIVKAPTRSMRLARHVPQQVHLPLVAWQRHCRLETQVTSTGCLPMWYYNTRTVPSILFILLLLTCCFPYELDTAALICHTATNAYTLLYCHLHLRFLAPVAWARTSHASVHPL